MSWARTEASLVVVGWLESVLFDTGLAEVGSWHCSVVVTALSMPLRDLLLLDLRRFSVPGSLVSAILLSGPFDCGLPRLSSILKDDSGLRNIQCTPLFGGPKLERAWPYSKLW